jgi:hypothetical protein
VVIGSLSILGIQDEDGLPPDMSMSNDIDSYTQADPARIFDLDEALGEGSLFHWGLLAVWKGTRRIPAERRARREGRRVPSAHKDRATPPCALRGSGPSGDLGKRPPAALQMLAVGAAMPALCALPAAVFRATRALP